MEKTDSSPLSRQALYADKKQWNQFLSIFLLADLAKQLADKTNLLTWENLKTDETIAKLKTDIDVYKRQGNEYRCKYEHIS